MKKGCLYMAACFLMATVHGQTEPSSLHKGIMKYKEGKFQEAVAAFTETLNLNDSHRIARYNLGLAWYKANEKEKAAAAFERVAAADRKDDLTIRSIYNKGVLEAGNKNWPASINAFREALRLAPNDEDIRYNLEKAIEENRKTKKQQEEKQKQEERKKQAPPKEAPPSNKKRMEQWLQSLRQKEQEIQRKMQQKNRTSSQPEKDW